ncbi:hypothetical protein [Pseudoduganella buxea]|uniref:Uncharacterized protein n=1 Tax=Pseudoduganella buxea TaxID=1949069 RepID=A0A6I3T0N9_9BURK|nr:hypothetical protein [Pseudoduganella buxea]MTV55160.1 hypothetical protein [Pseudoduganella buxea]
MKRAILLALAALSHLSAGAADVIVPHLAGTWGSAASLHAGTAGQTELHLQPDGFGLMAGSTPASQRIDGGAADKPAPRAVIGFPVRATGDGDMLTLQPFLPGGGRQAAKMARIAIACVHAATEAVLTCTGPDGVATAMRRRSATVPSEAAAQIEAARR